MFIDKNQAHIEDHFLTRSGEKLLFAARTHVFALFAPIAVTFFLTLLSIGVVVFLQKYFFFSVFVLGEAIFFILLASITLSLKLIADWYFHFYIITNFKMLEICYKPFFSKDISLVPLDQMRCVEVTSSTQGFINTIYDFGDITVQLDFLTHQDTFIMTDITSPQKTSMMLSDLFNVIIGGRNDDTPVTPLPIAYVRKDTNNFRLPSFTKNHQSVYPDTGVRFSNKMRRGEWNDSVL